jgi:hypothetical protein
MHTETAAQSQASHPAFIHDGSCPNCGRHIDFPAAALQSDGSHLGYCAACRTEVFEASLPH